MTIDWTKVAPVALSIIVILSVAVLRQYSKTIAAIAAVMPINIPLAMWIPSLLKERDYAPQDQSI